jgi:putative transposase
LRVGIKRYRVPVYGYCITSNHVHLVVHVDDPERVGLLMHLAAGTFAQHLNGRKGVEGSVWEHPYQCTIIQDGQHLIRCLRYVDLNMVRAGVVAHPTPPALPAPPGYFTFTKSHQNQWAFAGDLWVS